MSVEADRKLIERAFALQGPDNLDEYFTLWHDDAVFDIPYARPPRATRIESLRRIAELSGGFMRTWKTAVFHIDLILATEEPGLFVAEARGEIRLHNGHPYNNRYVCLIRIRDGKILLWREYFNPLVLNEANANPL
jgi:ketosteroid isomerase-like protein